MFSSNLFIVMWTHTTKQLWLVIIVITESIGVSELLQLMLVVNNCYCYYVFVYTITFDDDNFNNSPDYMWYSIITVIICDSLISQLLSVKSNYHCHF